jgi:hypothetical protein
MKAPPAPPLAHPATRSRTAVHAAPAVTAPTTSAIPAAPVPPSAGLATPLSPQQAPGVAAPKNDSPLSGLPIIGGLTNGSLPLGNLPLLGGLLGHF